MSRRTPLLSVVASAMLTLFSGSAQAIYVKTDLSNVVNNDARTATDFHFTYILPTNERTDYYFTSSTYSTTPSGTVTKTAVIDQDSQNWVGDQVTITGISIPTGGSIKIDASSTQNSPGNMAEIASVEFSYPIGPSTSPVPNWFWQFRGQVVENKAHHQVYTLGNLDALRSITFSTIEFRVDSVWHPAGTGTGGRPFYFAPGMILTPGDSTQIFLRVPESGSAQSFIYASGTMTHSGTGGNVPVPYVAGHEEALTNKQVTNVPSLAGWGVIALTGILAGLGSVVVLRKRRRETQA